VHYDICKHFFISRVTSKWNNLPEMVIVVRSVNNFKNALDEFWCNLAVLYAWRANLTGIESSSECI
jgi:hypothetical protein